MTTVDERGALLLAKHWLAYGERGLANALAVLTKAAEQMLGQADCAECGDPILGEPVTDPESLAWLGAGAPRFCSLACREAADEARIDAFGNGPS
jgi:hypothetical protein